MVSISAQRGRADGSVRRFGTDVMVHQVLELGDFPLVETRQRPALRLVEPASQPKLAPPSWMMAPPIPAEIALISVNEPQQPYLAIPIVPAAPMVADTAPYRSIREVPRRG